MKTLLNPPLTAALIDQLVDIWVEVTNAGGAVGFVPPVSASEVSSAVAGFWPAVRDGHRDLVVITKKKRPIGFGFLVPAEDGAVGAHRAEVQKVQRDPAHAGAGVGQAILAGIEACARTRGVDLLTLTVRDGTGTEGFYGDAGFALVARLPGWLQVGGVGTDALVMAKSLAGSTSHRLPVSVVRLDPDLPLPTYARPGDAGMDLMAREDRVLPAGTRCLMPTGVAVAIPEGFVGLIHPRSGLAVRQGLSVINSPGTIDAGYRGELKVPLINLDPSASIRITRGERIAQLLIQPVARAALVEVESLPDGVRGTGGFGSTGR